MQLDVIRRLAGAALVFGLLAGTAAAADKEPRFSQLSLDQLNDAVPTACCCAARRSRRATSA
jgi:hypothetical protein